MEKENRAPTTRDSDKYIVRMPEGMRDRIAAAAKLNSRTMNAEIVARLQQSFNLEPMKDAKRDELIKLVNEVVDQRLSASVMAPMASVMATGGPSKQG